MEKNTEKNNITIGDVADALGISKTTVSRAISGKGRIGEATRQRVLDYIKENNYKPNPMAKGLADQKTYNICWVVPGDYNVYDLPFFQRCMAGVIEETESTNYDVLLSQVSENDISSLERIVENKKVDGVILGRTLIEDKSVKFMKESGIPFVVIGSTPESGVVQIDNDHITGCREFTSILVNKGYKKLALVGGPMNHVVNLTRKNGFVEGLKLNGITPDPDMMFLENRTSAEVGDAAMKAVKAGADCIVCMDDRISYNAIMRFRKEDISIPGGIKLASFYNSDFLSNNQPAITTLQYDPKELGIIACRTLLQMIGGEEVDTKINLGYEVLMKGSA